MGCAWREKAKVCKFHAEDCTIDKCDFYNLEYDKTKIKQRIKQEIDKIKLLDKEQDKEQINDKYFGVQSMCMGLDDLSGGVYSKLAKTKYGRKLLEQLVSKTEQSEQPFK